MRHEAETMNTLQVATTEIQYSDRGEGDPILLVHAGVFADWFAPLANEEALRNHRIIRVRRAGYGPTSPAGPISLHEHAEHLVFLLRSLQVRQAHVVGHSSGALIALQLAADQPASVASLTLIEPAPLGPFQVPAFAQLGNRFVGPALAAFSAGDLPLALDSFMVGVCGADYREIIDRSLGSDAYETLLREAAFFFKDEIPATMQWQFGEADAARVSGPILLVEGAEGRRGGELSQQVTESAIKLFPRAEVTLIQGTSHMLPLQDAAGLASVLAEFTSRHRIHGRARLSGA